ncbi:MAG: SIS domain-containing protein [Phycisphaeraceae bacterium]|nr:SIS domain-containing protein [Phycisphaeraceae bacterium]
MSENPIQQSIRDAAQVIASLERQTDRIESICDQVTETLRRGKKILTAGHGGSAAEALHMSEELMGRFDKDRRPLPAVALTADPTLLTCIGNDYGFEAIFPRQVEGLCQSGDLLVIFSTSGNGNGFGKALEAARAIGGRVVALLGKGGGSLAGRADLELIVDSAVTARIQEAHQLLMHMILEAVDREFA